MTGYVNFVLRYRYFILIGIAVVTAVWFCVLLQGSIGTSLGTIFLGENPAYKAYKERVADFGGDGFIAIAFEEEDLLDANTVARLKKAVEEIETLPDVDRVESILDAGAISGSGGGLEVHRYLDDALEHPERVPELRQKLLSDDMAVGSVVSKDGRHTAMLVQLVFSETRAVEDDPVIVQSVIEKLDAAGFAAERLHLAGLIPVFAEVIDQTFFNLTRLTPIVLIVLLLVVWLMFRRLWPVLITGGVGLIAVIWTMGFAVALQPKISILAAMVPAVVLIISFSDVIHLCSAYLLELASGRSKEEAILESGTDVGTACVFTSLTTFAGFVSLSLIPAPVFRHLGVTLGFGVAVALLLAMTVAPIFFSFMGRPREWRRGTTAHVQDYLDRFLIGARRYSTGRPWQTVALFTVVAGFAVYGVSQAVIDTDFAGRLDDDNRIRKDLRYFEENFEGTGTLEVYVKTDRKEGIFEPAFFGEVAALQDRLEALPEVDGVVSLVDVMRLVHQEMSSSAVAEDSLPTSRELIAQYMLLLEMASGGYELDQLVDFERSTLRMLVRMPEGGVRRTHEVGVAAVELGKGVSEQGAVVEATGSMFLMGQWLDEIIGGQRNGLIFAFLSIAIMMMIGLRSVRAGLWSMIPNAFPLLVLGGWVGLFWDTVDSDTLAVGMIAIGIGVDDTIHFLMRLKIETRRAGNTRDALKNTFHFSGRAIVITSVVLIAGFAPLAISDYFPLHIMGTMLPLCLLVALLADLMLVPALVALGAIQFRGSE